MNVEWVPDFLKQILFNLLQNAVKAIASKTNPKIEVRVFHEGFEVIDNGMGMSDEIKVKIFQPFFTTFEEGTGLGLSICQRLLKSNQGSIEVHSGIGNGTRFRVVLGKVSP